MTLFAGVAMLLCETCGNKRCPHATDSALPCTDSNAPGQRGSAYEGALLSVVIPGIPVGKGRPRFARAGNFVRTFTPDKTAAWEDKAIHAFAQAWAGRAPLDESVELQILAIGPRPKSLIPKPAGSLPAKALKDDPAIVERQWRKTKPDFDNVLKAVADALTAAGVIRDDVLVARGGCDSLIAAVNEGPSVQVRLVRVGARP